MCQHHGSDCGCTATKEEAIRAGDTVKTRNGDPKFTVLYVHGSEAWIKSETGHTYVWALRGLIKVRPKVTLYCVVYLGGHSGAVSYRVTKEARDAFIEILIRDGCKILEIFEKEYEV